MEDVPVGYDSEPASIHEKMKETASSGGVNFATLPATALEDARDAGARRVGACEQHPDLRSPAGPSPQPRLASRAPDSADPLFHMEHMKGGPPPVAAFFAEMVETGTPFRELIVIASQPSLPLSERLMMARVLRKALEAKKLNGGELYDDARMWKNLRNGAKMLYRERMATSEERAAAEREQTAAAEAMAHAASRYGEESVETLCKILPPGALDELDGSPVYSVKDLWV